jgi:hypothetical protein
MVDHCLHINTPSRGVDNMEEVGSLQDRYAHGGKNLATTLQVSVSVYNA